jgi:protein-S-isoprenylcysteine O-methyltransferase Ste14
MGNRINGLILRSLIFTFLIPETVVGGIPTLLFYFIRIHVIVRGFQSIGLIFLVQGFAFYLISVISFIRQGKGTPMIYFMEKTEKIFGKEPITLVDTVFYKFSRNPMYLGVIVMIFGLGILLESISIIVWSLLSFLIFHIAVVKLEEPHLREKHGEIYADFCKKVPRWLGIRRFKN